MNWTITAYREERRAHLSAARSDRFFKGRSHWTREQLDERLRLLIALRRHALAGYEAAKA